MHIADKEGYHLFSKHLLVFNLPLMLVESIIIWGGYIFAGKSEKFDYLMQGNLKKNSLPPSET